MSLLGNIAHIILCPDHFRINRFRNNLAICIDFIAFAVCFGNRVIGRSLHLIVSNFVFIRTRTSKRNSVLGNKFVCTDVQTVVKLLLVKLSALTGKLKLGGAVGGGGGGLFTAELPLFSFRLGVGFHRGKSQRVIAVKPKLLNGLLTLTLPCLQRQLLGQTALGRGFGTAFAHDVSNAFASGIKACTHVTSG